MRRRVHGNAVHHLLHREILKLSVVVRVYGLDDRLRGINCTRMVVLMNKADIEEHGLKDGDEIDLLGAAGDAVPRAVRGLRVVTYDVPQGSCAGYYPECNPLLPLWHHAEGSHVPAAKSIPVRVQKRG